MPVYVPAFRLDVFRLMATGVQCPVAHAAEEPTFTESQETEAVVDRLREPSPRLAA
jgi:hypothetical protein